MKNDELNEWLSAEFKNLGDLERLISKVSFGRVNPRELLYLFKGLEFIPKLKNKLNASNHKVLKIHSDQLKPLSRNHRTNSKKHYILMLPFNFQKETLFKQA